MDRSTSTRTVAITGAGSGVGLVAALYYARKGWNVGLIGRGEPALDAARAEVEAVGGRALVAVADVADSGALARAAAEIEDGLGPIEVWINNAGIGFYGAFVDVPEDAFRRVLDVNLHGTVNGTRAALALMRPRNRGVIVQVLSAIGFRGVPLQSAYSASKYGLRGFTEAVRAELANERSGVHVTMVYPPAVNTPFYSHAGSVMAAAPRPPPPVFQPEILGEALYLAGTERRREWAVTGVSLALRTGNRLMPGVLDLVSGLVGPRAQQTGRADVAAVRDPNTFAASTRPAGAHGPFDGESLAGSVSWAVTKLPGPVRLGLGLGVLGLACLARGRWRRR